MNQAVEKLKTYLKEQPLNAAYQDAQSLLELLCYLYMTESPVESAMIRYQYHQIDEIVNRLTLAENDRLFSITVDLCDACTRKAFIDGIKVGYHLREELSA